MKKPFLYKNLLHSCFGLLLLFFIVYSFNQIALAKDCSAKEYQVITNKLENIFQEKGFGYTIHYPADWVYAKSSPYTVLFSGQEGTDAFYSTISIQNVASKKRGGKYEDIDSFVTDLKNQLMTGAKNTKIYNEKPLAYEKNWVKLTGKEFIAEYIRQGEHFKQRVIVIKRDTGEIFYAWFYTAPENLYNSFLPVAEAMLDSWTIIE
jgi:hypothetical protein